MPNVKPITQIYAEHVITIIPSHLYVIISVCFNHNLPTVKPITQIYAEHVITIIPSHSYVIISVSFNHNVIHCAFRLSKERNVLFNNALNTFYLRLYGVRHMVKDHSDSEKGNPLPPHRLLLSINSKGSFICTIPQTG